jgi:hypothetical protein
VADGGAGEIGRTVILSRYANMKQLSTPIQLWFLYLPTLRTLLSTDHFPLQVSEIENLRCRVNSDAYFSCQRLFNCG